MLFESKLREILKNEKRSFTSLLVVSFVLLPFIIWYINDGYNPTKLLNLLGIFSVYLLLWSIIFKKRKILKDIHWSLQNYVEFPERVQMILKIRKSSLISYHGKISLYTLYDDALKLHSNLEFEKCV